MEGRISKLFRSGLSMLVVLCMVVAMCPAVFAAAEDNITDNIDKSQLISLGQDMLGYVPDEVSAAFEQILEMLKIKDPAAAEELALYAKENGVLAAMKKAVAQLDTESAKIAVSLLQDVIVNAEEIYAALKNEVLTLDETLKSLKAKVEEAKAQLVDLQNQMNDAKAQLDDAKAQLDDAKVQLEEKKAELADVKVQLEEKKAQLEEKKAELAEAKEKLAEAEAELEQAKKDLEDAAAAGADTTEEAAKLADAEAKLNEKKAELADAEAKIADAEAQLADAEAKIADAETKLADAEQTLADYQTQYDDYMVMYEEYLALYNENAPKLEAAIAAIDEAIAKLDVAIAVVEEKMPRVEAAIEKMEGYIAALKAAVVTVQTQGVVDGVREAQPVVNDMLVDLEDVVAIVSEDTAAKLNVKIASIKAKLDALYIEANSRYYNALTGEYYITADSNYVALGDGSAAGEKTYVDALAAMLGVEFKNLSASDLTVEGAFDVLDEVASADLVTIGFGNEGFTRFATQKMWNVIMGRTVEFDWSVFGVKEEVLSAVEEAKAKLHDELVAAGLTLEFQGMEMADLLVTGVEAYAYSYASYVYNLPKLVDEIQAINPDATIVVVGTYNVLEGVTLVMDERELNVDRFMGYVAEVTDLSTLALAMLDENVVFVDAPAVETVNAEAKLKANEIIGASQYGDLVPTEASHLYIAEQIWNALTITKDEVPTVCEHETTWRYRNYPSCTAPGLMQRVCVKCGETFESQFIAPLGHAFGEWTVTKEATCTEPGEETSTCYVCGVTETREIEATGHNFGEWTVTKEASCTEKGEETRECECGEVETREIETTGHTFGAWAETKAPNCTDAGEKTRTCSVCGEVETAAIAAKGHKYGTWGINKGASCTEPGEGIRTCSVCGASETCVLEPTGVHAYGAWTVTTEPTCTVAGVETRTCSCGETQTREVPATGVHTFGDWTVTKEPTTEAEGEETRTCSQCGLKETRPVEKLPAEPVEEKKNLWWISLIVVGVGGIGAGGYFFLKKKQIF